MNQVPGIELFEKIDIKSRNISPDDLDLAASYAGGYAQVFSKRARKFRTEGLHEKSLSENDLRSLILSEYTFLKRPVFFFNDKVYIGNSSIVIRELINDING